MAQKVNFIDALTVTGASKDSSEVVRTTEIGSDRLLVQFKGYRFAFKDKDKKNVYRYYDIKLFTKKEFGVPKYIEKGKTVLVEGEVVIDNVKDKDDNWKTYASIVATKISPIFTDNNTSTKSSSSSSTVESQVPDGNPF